MIIDPQGVSDPIVSSTKAAGKRPWVTFDNLWLCCDFDLSQYFSGQMVSNKVNFLLFIFTPTPNPETPRKLKKLGRKKIQSKSVLSVSLEVSFRFDKGNSTEDSSERRSGVNLIYYRARRTGATEGRSCHLLSNSWTTAGDRPSWVGVMQDQSAYWGLEAAAAG